MGTDLVREVDHGHTGYLVTVLVMFARPGTKAVSKV